MKVLRKLEGDEEKDGFWQRSMWEKNALNPMH